LRNVRYVRFGSLADIKARIRDVRLSLKLRAHLADFLAAYNFAKRLKSLCGLTPHE
jgi:hypothetical protein